MTEIERTSMINQLYQSYNGEEYSKTNDKTSEFDSGTRTLYMLHNDSKDDGPLACIYLLQQIHQYQKIITPANQEKIRLLRIILQCVQNQFSISDMEITTLENRIFS